MGCVAVSASAAAAAAVDDDDDSDKSASGCSTVAGSSDSGKWLLFYRQKINYVLDSHFTSLILILRL